MSILPLSDQCEVKEFDWEYQKGTLQSYFVGCRVLQKCRSVKGFLFWLYEKKCLRTDTLFVICGYALPRGSISNDKNAPCVAKMALRFSHRESLEGYEYVRVKDYIYKKVETLEQTLENISKLEIEMVDKSTQVDPKDILTDDSDEHESTWFSDEDQFIDLL